MAKRTKQERVKVNKANDVHHISQNSWTGNPSTALQSQTTVQQVFCDTYKSSR